jgi:hypothetical protein
VAGVMVILGAASSTDEWSVSVIKGDGAVLHRTASVMTLLGIQSSRHAFVCNHAGLPMSIVIIVGVVSFVAALSGVVLANMFLIMMIGEINRKRQDNDLVSYFGFTFPKMVRIFDEYRRSYPTGKLHVYSLSSFGLAIIGLLSAAICLGIIGKVGK